MSEVVFKKSYSDLPFSETETLRYAACKQASSGTMELLQECLREAKGCVSFQICYRSFFVKTDGQTCDFGAFTLSSKNLSKQLEGCETAIVFAATVGVGIDRLIQKYSRISPSKALMFQAIGAERVEALCDRFCADIKAEYQKELRPRFSPGYGDLPITSQKELFAVLQCEKQIGLTLTSSFMMTPSKSVTAIVGLSDTGVVIKNKCSLCQMQHCTQRGTL